MNPVAICVVSILLDFVGNAFEIFDEDLLRRVANSWSRANKRR